MPDSSSLVADLTERQADALRQKCSFTRIKESMSSEEHSAVNKAEEEIRTDTGNGRAKTYSCTWLSEVLTKNGYSVSSSTISRHMNKRCGCE
jgi:hypothetical protein